MVGSQTSGTIVIASSPGTSLCTLENVNQARGDELHGAGDQAGVSLGNGLPLVSINTDAVQASIASNFDQGAVTGLATGTEDNIRAVLDRLGSGGGTPLRVGEGYIQATGMVGGDDVDARD